MTRDALDYIKRNLITETVIKHHGRAESTRVENFPYDAIEEAVVNAVYHRGYDTREPIEVRIEYSELMVISYPGPDRSVRLEQLRAGRAQPRRYRNRRNGEFLKELEFTEGRSTGIPKIMEAMAKNGSPPAEFEFDEDHSYFMVRLPIHPAALEVAESQSRSESRLESGGATQSPTQSGGESTQSRSESGLESGLESETSRSVLMALAADPLGRSGIAKKLGHERVSGAVNRAIKELLAKGLIEYTIPEKPNSRLQKYRRTQSRTGGQ